MYHDDLAYIHDAGFTDLARAAATWLLHYLTTHNVPAGRVVDLACGSGRTAARLTEAGYDVLGIDVSAAMVRLARQVAPDARFRVGSLYTAKIPPCSVVAVIGEGLDYCGKTGRQPPWKSFCRRVHRALAPRGLLVFDVLTGGVSEFAPRRHFVAGSDWAVGVTTTVSRSPDRFRRTITSFRRHGGGYRRSLEHHDVVVYERETVVRVLRTMGFTVSTRRSYSPSVALPGRTVVVARRV